MGAAPDRSPSDDDARQLLARFAERGREALLSDGWDLGPEGPASGDSIFLGHFRQPVAPDFVATVEFTQESGPIIREVQLPPLRGVVRTGRISARVGGELGVRHLPTERLIAELEIRCSADISLDLEEIFEDQGEELPTITDEDSADVAARVLVDAVAAHALSFARGNADVDRIVEFLRDGRQTTRDETFEYIFVPTLLAASGRNAESRAALAKYQKRIPTGSDEETEYSWFRDRLSAWLQ